MSTVYLARDLKLHKQWTIKEILKSNSSKKSKVNVDSLLEEANLIKKLDHPYIPRIVDIIETENTLFIVRDYIDGEPMDQVVKMYGSQPEASVIAWGKQICDVLGYLHNRSPRIIYRDMKPANLMLVSDGSIRLIDFGIAIEEGSNSPTGKRCIGTKGYAPAEQSKSVSATDERSDIYALGMTLCHLATGISPMSAGFNKKTVLEENLKSCSSQFKNIIEKCIADNPDDRFQNCSEVLYALNKAEHNATGNREKRSGGLKKLLSAVCLVLFVLIFILSLLLGTIDFGLDGVTELFGLKNLSFILSVAFLVAGLKFHDLISADKSSAGKQLTGSTSDYVVAEAKKGSFADMIYSGIDDAKTLSIDGSQALSELLAHTDYEETDIDSELEDFGDNSESTAGDERLPAEESSLDVPLADVTAAHENGSEKYDSIITEEGTELIKDEAEEDENGTELFDEDGEEGGTELFEEDEEDEDDDSFTTLLTINKDPDDEIKADPAGEEGFVTNDPEETSEDEIIEEPEEEATDFLSYGETDAGDEEEGGTELFDEDAEEGGTELFEEDEEDEDDDSFTTLLTINKDPDDEIKADPAG
ncbi:MAG: serine/threonine protein kinase, partial [Clostridia bacterium]|nr:serine/threonine protein kinase [Clostridia bacterium]